MNSYLLGIDIGTSSCKVAIFNKMGEVLAQASSDYPVYYPAQGYAEQDPVLWWKAVCAATIEVLRISDISPQDIIGVGIDGQSWSAVAMDKEGSVLCNTPIWMDTRASDICERMEKKIGSKAIFDLSGNSLKPSYSTGKILWYKEHLPEVYKHIHKILQCNSYIVYQLTGLFSQDKSQGYGLHCFNMHTGKWDEAMCSKLGIPFDFLPDIYECHEIVGNITKKASLECGLAPGTPVVAGGLDAACGTLGAGVLQNGETQEQGGQAGGMSICMEQYDANPALILGFHVVPNRWLLQGGTTGGGGVMRWLEQEFADYEREIGKKSGKSSLDVFNEMADLVRPGSDGMVFLPYMAGERSPIWDSKAKGVYYGLDFSKSKGHMIRSSMEGVAFSLLHNLDVAKQTGAQVEELRAMGGSANSRLWTQIKCDVTGIPIKVPSSDTATTLGAAILAGVGVGLYKNFEEAVNLTVHIKREHKPNMANHQIYMKNYAIYLELYNNLKDTMKKSSNM